MALTKKQQKDFHRWTSDHREEIEKSPSCGCFFCGAIYPPGDITEWIDRRKGIDNTALCPKCGVDSVLPCSKVKITHDLLGEMSDFWFGDMGCGKGNNKPYKP